MPASAAVRAAHGRPAAVRARYAAVCVALVLLPAWVNAQPAPKAEQWFRRGTVLVTVQAGGAAFTDFQRATVRASSAELEPYQFQRRIGPRTSPSLGAWTALWLTDVVGVRAGVSWAPTSFAVRNEPTAQRALDQRAADGPAAEYAGLGVLHGDVAVMFRFPVTFGRVAPYGLAGGGVVRYWKSGAGELPPEARDRFGRGAWHGFAGVVGVGSAIALQKRELLLVFELTDHISRTPLDGAGAGEWFEVSGVRMQLEPDEMRVDNDGVGWTSSVRLHVGLSLPLR